MSSIVQVEIIEEVVEITEIAQQGPPGPAGPAGSSSDNPWTEDPFLSLAGNQTIFILGDTPRTGTLQMYVNGLRQHNLNFSTIGSTVTVAGFTPTTGDDVSFVYQIEV